MSRLNLKWDINYSVPMNERLPNKNLNNNGVDDNKKTYNSVISKAETILNQQKSKPIVNKNYVNNPLWKTFDK